MTEEDDRGESAPVLGPTFEQARHPGVFPDGSPRYEFNRVSGAQVVRVSIGVRLLLSALFAGFFVGGAVVTTWQGHRGK